MSVALSLWYQKSRELLSNMKMLNSLKQKAKLNPITGQHVELTVQSASHTDLDKVVKKSFSEQLPKHMMPKTYSVASISVGHRFKKA